MYMQNLRFLPALVQRHVGKPADFTHPSRLTPLLGMTPFEFCVEIWHQKTRIMALPYSEEIMTVDFFV